MKLNRRHFIGIGAAAGLGSLLIFKNLDQILKLNPSLDERLDGFKRFAGRDSYFHPDLKVSSFSIKGEIMNDGIPVPAMHDGMACFQKNGGFVLTRNHEIGEDAGISSEVPGMAYDSLCKGGVSVIELDEKFNVTNQYLALTGTATNCSGGATTWGTWLTCEETFSTPGQDANVGKRHGYVFEVDPRLGKLTRGEPLPALGRFMHEAVATGPTTGYLYMTEDRGDGCFYRFIPNVKENLKAGGRLQALSVDANMKGRWLDVLEPDPEKDTVRYTMKDLGATTFARGEGIVADATSIYFTASTGGSMGLGQIYKVLDSPGETTDVTKVYEATDKMYLQNPDQMTVNSWGDLILCEDPVDRDISRLRGLTPEGKLYTIAVSTDGELAGVCFSPDMKTIFVNQQKPGITYAIHGDWEKIRREGRNLL
jgi:uncharacterized protein